MNDLDLLRRHGPRPAVLTSEVRQQARAALLAEARAGHSGVTTLPPPRGRRWFAAAAVAAVLALGLALLPGLLGGGPGSMAVALTPASPPAFPYTATVLPEGLGDPAFERDGTWEGLFYGSGNDGLALFVSERPGAAVPDGGRELRWEDGETHLTLRGTGRYAEDALLARVKAGIERRPQPVGFGLTLAPAGYEPVQWKSGRIMTWSRSGGSASDRVSLQLDAASTDGLVDPTTVSVQGTTATAAPAMGGAGWVVVARTRTGRPFTLVAGVPGLTLEQAVELADAVTASAP